MFVLKNRYDLELSEANSHAKRSHNEPFKKVAEKYSPSHVSIILFRHFTVVTPKKTHRMNVATKTHAHTINVQSHIVSMGESQMVDITPVWYLQITESSLLGSIHLNVMLLLQFLSAIRQISTEFFFIFQHDSAPAHRTLEAISSPPPITC